MDSSFNLRLDEPQRFPNQLSSYEEELLLDESSEKYSPLSKTEGDELERLTLGLIQKDNYESFFMRELNYGIEELVSAPVNGITRTNQAHQILGSTKGYLQYFLRVNYTGPDIHDDEPELCPNELSFKNSEEREKWTLDGEGIVENIDRLGMVHLAERMLSPKYLAEVCPSALWWGIRAYFLHQNCLEEKSNILWTAIKKCIELFDEFLENRNTQIRPELVALYNTELTQIYAFYYDTENAKKRVSKAKEVTGMITFSNGVMGKRTRHQQTEVAQLILEVELNGGLSGSAPETPPPKHIFPQAVVLDDEDRLDQLNLTNDGSVRLTGNDLHEIQHLILLAEFNLKRKYLPHDGIYREELAAYLRYLIDSPKVWAVQMTCLLQRSVLELDSRRTVERSMAQLQVLRDVIVGPRNPSRLRVKYFYGSGLCMKWEIRVALSQVLTSLNLHKEALDIAVSLGRFEDVISCYTNLNLRHKAEEVIRNQLEKTETVKLWILLGDATDNPEYYEIAWVLSNERSARAQRQWGYYYFARKDYAAAIPHLHTSVELNPLENPAWIRLGFAALSTEAWKLSTRAYQHSSTLEADNFEVWNNLGHGFIKLGEKQRAMKALKEASKCNYESWKVWENLMVVATDCKAFDEVIRCYNRLIDLKGKWEDEQVLGLLVRAIVTNIKDSSDHDSRKYLKDALKLFGRITAAVTTNPRIWKLYSDLVLIQNEIPEALDSSAQQDLWIKSVGYSQRSVEAILADSTWSKIDARIEEAVDLALEYIKRVAEFIKNYADPSIHSDALTKAQFTVKRIYAGVKKTRDSAIQLDKYDKYLAELKQEACMIQMENL